MAHISLCIIITTHLKPTPSNPLPTKHQTPPSKDPVREQDGVDVDDEVLAHSKESVTFRAEGLGSSLN